MEEQFVKVMSPFWKRRKNHEIFIRYRSSEHSSTTNRKRLQQSFNTDESLKGYEMMTRLLNDFKVLPLVSFDTGAAEAFNQLQSQRIQLAKMDARIASIALFRGLVLLTRNHQDFGKATGLLLEDWTI